MGFNFFYRFLKCYYFVSWVILFYTVVTLYKMCNNQKFQNSHFVAVFHSECRFQVGTWDLRLQDECPGSYIWSNALELGSFYTQVYLMLAQAGGSSIYTQFFQFSHAKVVKYVQFMPVVSSHIQPSVAQAYQPSHGHDTGLLYGTKVKFTLKHAKKTQSGAEVWIYAVTWALNCSMWSEPRPGRFIPGKRLRFPVYRRLGRSES